MGFVNLSFGVTNVSGEAGGTDGLGCVLFGKVGSVGMAGGITPELA